MRSLKSLLGNCLLDVFDGDRIIVDAQHAACLAGRWANPTGEFREVVRAAEDLDRLFPFTVIHGIIEVRDIVSKRAAVVTKRYTAVHTTGGLLFHFLLVQRVINFSVIFKSFFCVARLWHFAIKLHKSIYLSHAAVTI